MQAIIDTARQFTKNSAPLTVSPLGNGLINDTYLVSSTASQWVLQRINQQVFPKPQWLMDNLHQLGLHVRQKSSANVRLKIPATLNTLSEQSYLLDAAGHYWRAFEFVANSISKEQVANEADAAQVGWALGHFHGLCSDMDVNSLHDTLPGFHVAPDYLHNFQQALAEAHEVAHDEDYHFCLNYITRHQGNVSVLEDAKHNGALTLRVMHGDPKVNNFLFDQHTQQIVSLIDLDTVKPGLLHYDIGDCLRSCCYQDADDSFDLKIAEAILKSYLAEVQDFFTGADRHYLYAAIELIPFELGLRFFTDYLEGNRYFKVTTFKQNCLRAAAQFRLCESIREQRGAIEGFIDRVAPSH